MVKVPLTTIGLETKALALEFCAWLKRAASTGKTGRDPLPGSVFSINDQTIILDVTRASQLIRQGLAAGTVSELIDLLGLTSQKDLSQVLNVSSTRLRSWARNNKQLPTPTVEKILRTMQLQLFASDVFGGVEPARMWLQKPHPVLNALAPRDYANNEFGAQKVRGMLAGLKYGGIA